ncbi:hypothetical protein BGW38_009683 [Lunasporangiospora selenospora]|uniref:Uncharacterized protein n=1 Tax=Lunasporangiospora selenospora TaxID=979761 RepID=A0A9P6FXS4_9FUNG|nr:hypothetical protein BGW38_009683 [Lunasporangiospora selenospora]
MPKERGDSQRWHVSYEEDDVVSIRSIRSGLYLSIPQAPFPGEVLVVSDNEQRWKVQKTDQDQFFIETMEKFDGTRLMIDEAYGSIYPRLAALDLPRKGGDQAWSFQKVDDNPRYYRRPYRQTGFYHY